MQYPIEYYFTSILPRTPRLHRTDPAALLRQSLLREIARINNQPAQWPRVCLPDALLIQAFLLGAQLYFAPMDGLSLSSALVQHASPFALVASSLLLRPRLKLGLCLTGLTCLHHFFVMRPTLTRTLDVFSHFFAFAAFWVCSEAFIASHTELTSTSERLTQITETNSLNDELLQFYEARANVQGSFVLRLKHDGTKRILRKTQDVLKIF